MSAYTDKWLSTTAAYLQVFLKGFLCGLIILEVIIRISDVCTSIYFVMIRIYKS